jgi:predicted NUDIX family NTP pyrophosphohydrolase
MSKKSAGILLYKINKNVPLFFLVHPGGPFWKKKDKHAWSIPKGEVNPGEDLLKTALREFREETGHELKPSHLIELKPIKQKGGKIVYAWAVKGDFDPSQLKSNSVKMIWPPGTNKEITFPEIDKAQWFTIQQAKEKINESQFALIEELLTKLKEVNE